MPPFPTHKRDYVDDAIAKLTDTYRAERPVVVVTANVLVLETDVTNEITTEGGSSLAVE